jgi:hypothetical protein
MQILGTALVLAAATLSSGCSSPTIALRDLRAIHELEQQEASSDGALAEPDRVRYRTEALLYGNFDRWIFESGLGNLLPEIEESWVAPESEVLDEPEILGVELLMELEAADPRDTALACRTLAVIGGYLLHDPAPLARRRCAAILGRLAAALPRAEGSLPLEGAAADLRFAALVRQIRQDLSERMVAAAEGRAVDEAMLARHREPLAELRTVEIRLLGVLADVLDLDAPAVLRDELETSCRVLGGGLARRQLAFALERRDADEWVRSELATAWIASSGASGLEDLLRWCGGDDSEPVRRTLIFALGSHSIHALRTSGALRWLAERADDATALSSQDAARVLRGLTSLSMQAGEGWVAALAEVPGS